LADDVNKGKMEETVVLTDEEIHVLIQFYEANPCLYLIIHADYQNREKKCVLENEIAAILQKPGKICVY